MKTLHNRHTSQACATQQNYRLHINIESNTIYHLVLVLGILLVLLLPLLLLLVAVRLLLPADAHPTVPVLAGIRRHLNAHADPMVPGVASIAADHGRSVVNSSAGGTNPNHIPVGILHVDRGVQWGRDRHAETRRRRGAAVRFGRLRFLRGFLGGMWSQVWVRSGGGSGRC